MAQASPTELSGQPAPSASLGTEESCRPLWGPKSSGFISFSSVGHIQMAVIVRMTPNAHEPQAQVLFLRPLWGCILPGHLPPAASLTLGKVVLIPISQKSILRPQGRKSQGC
jgi:hypothetical protein